MIYHMDDQTVDLSTPHGELETIKNIIDLFGQECLSTPHGELET